MLVASDDDGADLCAKHLTEKEIAMDASLLRKWIVGFIGAFFLNEASFRSCDAPRHGFVF